MDPHYYDYKDEKYGGSAGAWSTIAGALFGALISHTLPAVMIGGVGGGALYCVVKGATVIYNYYQQKPESTEGGASSTFVKILKTIKFPPKAWNTIQARPGIS